MSFVLELWRVPAGTQEILVYPRDLHDGGLRRLGRGQQRFGDLASHLHAVLGRTFVRTWHLILLPQQGRNARHEEPDLGR